MHDKDLRHSEYVIYCIETYKGAKGLGGAGVYQLLKETGAIDYIDGNYAALHTFGDGGVVWNIDEYLRNHESPSNGIAFHKKNCEVVMGNG